MYDMAATKRNRTTQIKTTRVIAVENKSSEENPVLVSVPIKRRQLTLDDGMSSIALQCVYCSLSRCD